MPAAGRTKRACAPSDLPEARQTAGMLDYVLGRGFQSYCVLIDFPARVAAAAAPELIETTQLHCDIATEGELTRGMTVSDVRGHFRWQDLPLIDAGQRRRFPAPAGIHPLASAGAEAAAMRYDARGQYPPWCSAALPVFAALYFRSF